MYTSLFTYDSSNDTGRTGLRLTQAGNATNQLNLYDLIDSGELYYAGSVVTVKESVTFILAINDPELIDVDLNWFFPRKYLGTWQVIDFDSVTWEGDEDKAGFINTTTFTIQAISSHTIGASTSDATKNGIAFIDNCNYAVGELGFEVGSTSLKIQAPITDTGLFVLNQVKIPSLLSNVPIEMALARIGLFLYPGARVESATRTVAGVSIIPVIDPTAEVATCLLPKSQVKAPTCDELFAKHQGIVGPYRDNAPLNSLEPGFTYIFSTKELGTRTDMTKPVFTEYICKVDPFTRYPEWRANGL